MANTIKIKNSGTASNVPSQLVAGEIAVNYADGKVYYGNASNGVNSFSLTINGTAIPVGGSGTVTANSQTLTSVGTNGTVLTSNGTATVWTANTGTGNVVRDTSPTLTNVRINSSGGTTPLIIGNIDSVNEGGEITLVTSNASAYANVGLDSYQGTFRVLTGSPVVATFIVSNTGTTVGTVNSGTWQGSVISSTYGGTGVNNGGRTITLNTGNLTLTAQSGGSSVTVPSTGTLATLAGTETLSNKTFSDQTVFSLTTDASGTVANTGTVIVGNISGQHIAIDGNEVMSKSNGTTPAALFLNNDGGIVYTGGDFQSNGVVTSSQQFDSLGAFWTARDANGDVQFRSNTTNNVHGATTAGGIAVLINSAGTLGTTTSTIRNKEDITNYEFDTEAVLSLTPKRFHYKKELMDPTDWSDEWEYGFIAEEALEAGFSEFVKFDSEGLPFYFAYERMCIAQQQIIRELWDKVKVLENEVSVLKQG